MFRVAEDPPNPDAIGWWWIVDERGGDSIFHLDVLGVPDQMIDELRHAGLIPT